MSNEGIKVQLFDKVTEILVQKILFRKDANVLERAKESGFCFY